MQIDLDRFVALTALLAAPLLAAPACVITTNGGNDDDTSAGTNNATTDDATTANMTTGMSQGTTNNMTTGMEGSSGDGTTAGTAADESAGSGSSAGDSTGGNAIGNCCEPRREAGCEVTEVSDCVCAEDAFCCETQWDANCVVEVNMLACGECELPPTVWECSCTVTGCEGIPIDMTWQVCGADEIEAATNGQTACEMSAENAGCDSGGCSECLCFTAEAPMIDCIG